MAAPQRRFGTDGIRDVAGKGNLQPELIVRVGRGLGAFLRESSPDARRRVLIGRDPRESSMALTTLIAGGLQSEGFDVRDVGVVPTPALALLTKQDDACLGVMISASHNPAADNGIKVFAGGGEKITEEQERLVETHIARLEHELDADRPNGSFEIAADASDAYHDELVHRRHPGLKLDRLKIAVDCANGATFEIAPRVLEALGATVHRVACEPDGININRDCGATRPDAVQATVRDQGADIGISLDGDGDRVMLVDETGVIRDGDEILGILARYLGKEGRLTHDTVVATVMSNLGLEVALRADSIRLVRTAVGDKYVAREMLEHGYVLGGEQSGHIILSETGILTGDGLATALAILEVMQERGLTLSRLAGELERYPQILENVRVSSKPDLATVDGVSDAVRRAEDDLGDRGRVLLRYSGTEKLARVMVEGPDHAQVSNHARQIADIIRDRIGERPA